MDGPWKTLLGKSGAVRQHAVQPERRPFDQNSSDGAFAPNHEVADVVWTPLEPMYKGENHTAEIPDGGAMQFNGFGRRVAVSSGE